MTTGVFFALQIFREREGYHAVTALNGEIALATAVTQKPSLTVTDWMMPRIDGVELCRRLKNDDATADIPVVMLSAALPPRPQERLWDELFQKPYPLAD